MIALPPNLDKATTKVVSRATTPGTAAIVVRAENAAVTTTISGTDRALDAVQKGGNALGMGAFLVPTILGVASAPVRWVNKKAGDVVNSPGNFLGKPLHEVVNTSGLKRFEPTVTRIGAFLENAGNKVGLTPWFADRKTAKGNRLFGKATQLTTGLSDAPSALRPHFNEVERIIGHGARGGALDVEGLTKAQTAIGELTKADGALAKAAKGHVKVANKAIAKATAAVGFHEAAAGYRNVGSSFTKAIKEIPKSSVGSAVSNVGFLAAAGASLVAVTLGIFKDAKGLHEMSRDEKAVSAAHPGEKSSKVVTKERNRFIKSAAVKIAAEGLGIGLTIAQALKGNMSVGTMAKFAIPQMVAGAASQMMGESAGRHYSVLKKIHRAKKEIPAAAIAEFIAVASPELRQRGGIESAFTLEIARQLAAEHLTPAQILHEASHGIKARVDKITAAQKETSAPSAGVAAAPESKTSFADRVSGGKKPGEVVGAGTHTNKLSEAASEQPTTGLSV